MNAFWDIVVSNCLVAAALAGGVSLLGRCWKNPAALHLLWVFVLLKLVTPPVLTLPIAWPQAHAPIAAAEQESNRNREPVSRVEHPPVEHVSSAEIRPSEGTLEAPASAATNGPDAAVAPSVAEGRVVPWLVVVTWTWSVGIALFAFAQAYRILRFRRLLRAAEPAPSGVLEMAERAARRIGLRRVPRIVMLPVRIAPLVWSLSGRPRVVLPAALFDRLDRAAQGAILAHELAHVRRKDHWVRLLELLVVTLFWWHPVAWWACRQLRELEEQCCDGMVLGTGRHDSRAYAIALLDTLEFLSESSVAAPLGATAAEPTLSLARRIKMLRNSSTVTRLTLGRLLLLAALAAAPMALAFAVEPPEMKEPSRLAAEELSAEAAPRQAASISPTCPARRRRS